MSRCRVDTSIERVVVGGFDFPLGAYPIEAIVPGEGYTTHFESADGGEDDAVLGDGWEEWPDRYVWDVVIRAGRVEAFWRSLAAHLPGRFFPILDVLGNDAYRENDPYVADELVSLERFMEGLRRFKSFLFEDGLVGFGAMSDEPFFYIFVDEHKVVTIRAEAALKEKVEAVLEAFDLRPVEKLASVDSVMHEHRSVLDAPDDRPDLLTPDEVIEELRDLWTLTLNVDDEANADENGAPLGITPFRCLVRLLGPSADVRYIDVFLTADCLRTAWTLAMDAAEDLYQRDVEKARRQGAAGRGPKSGGGAGEGRGDGAGGEGAGGSGSGAEKKDGGRFRAALRGSFEDQLAGSPDEPIDIDVIHADRVTGEEFGSMVPDGRGRNLPMDCSRVIGAQWLE